MSSRIPECRPDESAFFIFHGAFFKLRNCDGYHRQLVILFLCTRRDNCLYSC